MDSSWAWLSEIEMQDQGFVNQYQMIRPYHLAATYSVGSFSSESNSENPCFVDQALQTPSSIKETINIKRLRSHRTSNDSNEEHTRQDEKPWPKPRPPPNIPNTFTISFGDPNPKDEVILFNDSLGCTTGTKKGPTVIRNRIQLQEHMLAERKRREKLARRFISLSALLPDVKKMDKAAVLEDASNYIRELQSRVKELEGSSDFKAKNIQSTTYAKRLKLSRSNDHSSSSSDEENFGEFRSPCNPEIEVKVSGSNVLVRIYCQKNYISSVKLLNVMEKLGLSITSSSSFPFASTTFVITIIATKKNGFFMTSTDLVKSLQLAI
ncbi:hypothetical protein L2E82_33756 [Cichorium intybus]|uniref:Uncharacterized protein n=1 Tax=Cichorium intybus TaxID=13427 RepID=A0ACB9BL53_CICIN|nr:hypothetical protein L2E82_33756 [Cichorium intybus]